MKRILAFLFIITMFAIAFIAAPALVNPTGFVVAEDIEEVKEKELPSFRIYTKAICEDESGFIMCHDELFANCEGVEYELPKDEENEIFNCNGFEFKLPKNEVNGKGIFSKNWEDPRYIVASSGISR